MTQIENRRNRLDLNTPAELAITNAIMEIEKAGAHPKLTEVSMLLQRAKDVLADYIDESPAISNIDKKQFLLIYHLGLRNDEGCGNIALVSAHSLEEAKVKLKDHVSYDYIDTFKRIRINPDNIKCLNID